MDSAGVENIGNLQRRQCLNARFYRHQDLKKTGIQMYVKALNVNMKQEHEINCCKTRVSSKHDFIICSIKKTCPQSGLISIHISNVHEADTIMATDPIGI